MKKMNVKLEMNPRRITFLLFCFLLCSLQLSATVVGDRFTTRAKENPSSPDLQFQVTSLQDMWGQKNNVKFLGTQRAGSVVIPATVNDTANIVWNVTAIGSGGKIPNVTALTLPNTINRIEATVLGGDKLTQLNIPASVKEITNGAFAFCLGLQTLTVDAGNTKFSASDGVLYEKDNNGKPWLKAYPANRPGTAFNIPNGVYGLHPNAFQQSKSLTSVNVPASVEQIPAEADYVAFTSATQLVSITVDPANTHFQSRDGVVFSKDGKKLVAYPDSKVGRPYVVPTDLGVEEILGGSFSKSGGIETIVLPPSLKVVGKNSFKDCIHLISVEVPKAVINIEDGAFAGSYQLKAIDVEEGNAVYKSDQGVVYSADGKTLVAFPAGKVGEYTTLPTTEVIHREAFLSATKITKLTLTKGVQKIENNAFQYTSSLKELVFEAPSSFKAIGGWCFVNSGLEHLQLPSSLENLGDGAFYGCSKLQTVTVADGSHLVQIGKSAFSNCGQLSSFSFLGSSVLQKIDNDAFTNDKKLTTFVFPASVQSIEKGAFNNCGNLTSVQFASDAVITTIGAGAFQNSGLLSIDIPKSVVNIEQSAFNSCQKLTTIFLPAATVNVDPKAFLFCGSLSTIHADKDNPMYSSIDGFLLSKDKKKLVVFPPGKASTYYTMIPPIVEEIGPFAFYYIQKLENVTLPKNLQRIDEHAFDMCKQLNTIAFLGLTPVPAANVHPTAFYAPNIDKTKISINVRKEALAAYQANPFWSTGFKTFTISFMVDKNGFGPTEFFPLSKKAVSIVDVQRNVYTYVVPKKVTNPNDGKEYEVRLWADYAMNRTADSVKIEEVVFNNQLDYIGIDAFKRQDGTSTVKSLFFTTVLPAKDMSATKWEMEGYEEFTSTLKNIYVKKSAVNNYKVANGWKRYAGKVDYKIPGLTLPHKYGTFAREFDADLSVYFEEHHRTHGLPAAFVASCYGIASEGVGDHGDPDPSLKVYHIRMESVDKHGGPSDDPHYVPKFTGVLLKNMTEEALPDDFYYAIGEKDHVDYDIANCILVGMTEKSLTVKRTNETFVVSGSKGYFKRPKNAYFRMPIHRAYANLSGVPASARIVFTFDDGDTEITSIEELATQPKTDSAYYTLDGRRVVSPKPGLYILNGKKVVVK